MEINFLQSNFRRVAGLWLLTLLAFTWIVTQGQIYFAAGVPAESPVLGTLQAYEAVFFLSWLTSSGVNKVLMVVNKKSIILIMHALVQFALFGVTGSVVALMGEVTDKHSLVVTLIPMVCAGLWLMSDVFDFIDQFPAFRAWVTASKPAVVASDQLSPTGAPFAGAGAAVSDEALSMRLQSVGMHPDLIQATLEARRMARADKLSPEVGDSAAIREMEDAISRYKSNARAARHCNEFEEADRWDQMASKSEVKLQALLRGKA